MAGARSNLGRADGADGEASGPGVPAVEADSSLEAESDATEVDRPNELSPIVGGLAGSRAVQNTDPHFNPPSPLAEATSTSDDVSSSETAALSSGGQGHQAGPSPSAPVATVPSESSSAATTERSNRGSAPAEVPAHGAGSPVAGAGGRKSGETVPGRQVPGLDMSLEEILRDAVLRRGGQGRLPHPSDPVPTTGGPGESVQGAHQLVGQAVADAVRALDPGTHGTAVAAEVGAVLGTPAHIPQMGRPGESAMPLPNTNPEALETGTDGIGAELPSAGPAEGGTDGVTASVSVDTAGDVRVRPTSPDATTEANSVELDALVGDLAEGDGPDLGPLGTSPRGGLDGSDVSRRVAALTARIEQWIDQVRSAPPPNVMTVRPEGQDGYAIRVAFESGSLYVSIDGAQPDDVAWVRQALDQLTRKGLDLGGFEMSQSSDHRQGADDESARQVQDGHALAGSIPQRTRSENGLRL